KENMKAPAYLGASPAPSDRIRSRRKGNEYCQLSQVRDAIAKRMWFWLAFVIVRRCSRKLDLSGESHTATVWRKSNHADCDSSHRASMLFPLDSITSPGRDRVAGVTRRSRGGAVVRIRNDGGDSSRMEWFNGCRLQRSFDRARRKSRVAH